jgi:hypothetical protein
MPLLVSTTICFMKALSLCIGFTKKLVSKLGRPEPNAKMGITTTIIVNCVRLSVHVSYVHFHIYLSSPVSYVSLFIFLTSLYIISFEIDELLPFCGLVSCQSCFY